jgi:CobQ-like glutamine amidotransferase family enzyme
MDEILDQDDLDLVALGGGSDLAQQVLLAIGQHEPAAPGERVVRWELPIMKSGLSVNTRERKCQRSLPMCT